MRRAPIRYETLRYDRIRYNMIRDAYNTTRAHSRPNVCGAWLGDASNRGLKLHVLQRVSAIQS
eukprot:1134119-Lingulodinium_polyedra.AAC.1